jgi:hypothetical protein
MKTTQRIIMVGALMLALTTNLFAQIDTNLQFTGINATVEGAIQPHWASQPNHIYQIQYDNALATNDDGSTAWQTLYDNYPSHGTNTFILDTGDYFQTPPIVHPKYSPMRFYRVVDEGTNSGESPTITITSPTNGYVLSDEVTVSVTASSSYPIVNTKLYVDGQEMNPGDDGNYIINTCEWPNGPHTLFATATAFSTYPGPRNNSPLIGRAVSSYVPVTFSNLISRIAFSQQFFQPSLGQTQEVTATFAANSDWTLQIIDESSNVVRTATGSGNWMTFDWDGTGDGETNIPDGVYHYVISAETNGEADEIVTNGSGGGGGSPPSPDLARSLSFGSDSSELWAVAPDSENVVPFAIYPPGFDTNSLTIFKATPSEAEALIASASSESTVAVDGGGGVFADDASPAYSGPSSQSSVAPSRPQTAPVKNQVDSFSIGYFNFPNGRTLNVPYNGQPPLVQQQIHLDGDTSDTTATYPPVPSDDEARNFVSYMNSKGWICYYNRHDDKLRVQDIRRNDQGYGGSQIFTQATIGVYMGHGSYGINLDYSPGGIGSYQTYMPSGNSSESGDNAWLRMCQFGFGGSLKWMVLDACFTLTDNDGNFNSMKNHGGIPLNTTHLICSATTTIDMDNTIEQRWATHILKDNQTIANAWFNAGYEAYHAPQGTNTDTVVFRVAGYPECLSDQVTNNVAPSSPSSSPGNLSKTDFQVSP